MTKAEDPLSRGWLTADQPQADILDKRIHIILDKTKGIRPSTEQELYLWYQLYLGVKFPRRPVVEGHNCAFEFIADHYFKRVSDSLLLSCRTGMKTLATEAIIFGGMYFDPGDDWCSLAGSEEQSRNGYKYARNWWELKWFKPLCAPGHPMQTRCTLLPRRFNAIDRPYRQDVPPDAFGSEYSALTASMKSVNSPHPRGAKFDEIDLMDPAVYDEALSMPISKHGRMPTFIRCSTRKFRNGPMQRAIESCEANPESKIYMWNWIDIAQKCKCSAQECRTCVLREMPNGEPDCAGLLRNVNHNEGFWDIELLRQRKQTIPEEIWRTQWRCERPGAYLNVYPSFRREVHVRPVEWKQGMDCYSLHDFGFKDPSVQLIVAYLRGTDTVLVLHEEFDRMARINALVKDKWYPNYVQFKCQGAIVDNSRPDLISQVVEGGIDCLQYRKPEIMASVEQVRDYLSVSALLEAPRLFIDPSCKETIWEFENYEMAENTDKPADANNHAMDCMRYFVHWLRQGRISHYKLGQGFQYNEVVQSDEEQYDRLPATE